jgi:hypothetical protein
MERKFQPIPQDSYSRIARNLPLALVKRPSSVVAYDEVGTSSYDDRPMALSQAKG